MASFIEGPLWYFSLAVFAIGVLWQLGSILFSPRKTDLSKARAPSTAGALKTLLSRFVPKPGMGGQITMQVVAGYLFHLGLLALMFFAAPHVVFFEQHLLGFGWPAMPYWAFILSAQAAFLGLIMLWLRRLVDPVSRLISTRGDHVGTLLTFIVMLTGCFALLEGADELRLLHRFTVELWLLYFPFSSLMHSFTFVPSRLFTGAWFARRGIDA